MLLSKSYQKICALRGCSLLLLLLFLSFYEKNTAAETGQKEEIVRFLFYHTFIISVSSNLCGWRPGAMIWRHLQVGFLLVASSQICGATVHRVTHNGTHWCTILITPYSMQGCTLALSATFNVEIATISISRNQTRSFYHTPVNHQPIDHDDRL